MQVSPFTATFCAPERIDDLAHFLAKVKEDYVTYRQDKAFADSDAPAMYAYEVANNREATPRLGLVAAVSVKDYLEERVKRHEQTLVAKELKQAELLKQRTAVVKPILLAHRKDKSLEKLLRSYLKKAPNHSFTLPNPKERHRFWAITNAKNIALVQERFAKEIKQSYIADGHHRFSAIARLYEQHSQKNGDNPYTHMMCALFPDNSLEIHNFNRAVKFDPEQISPLGIIAKLSHYAEIEVLDGPKAPSRQHELSLYLKGEWFLLRWRTEILRTNSDIGVPGLDVSMLNYYVLKKILGLRDIRNDKRIRYVEGPRGLRGLVDDCTNRNAMGFCLHPLEWDAFFRVIDQGLVLPPKSTWFEPRMRNGVIVQSI